MIYVLMGFNLSLSTLHLLEITLHCSAMIYWYIYTWLILLIAFISIWLYCKSKICTWQMTRASSRTTCLIALWTLEIRAGTEPLRRLKFHNHGEDPCFSWLVSIDSESRPSIFNQEKTLVGAFSVTIRLQTLRRFVSSSIGHWRVGSR